MTPIDAAKVDWNLTEFVIGILKLKVDKAKVGKQ